MIADTDNNPINQKIHHLTTHFAFVIFSSSQALKVSISDQYTIDHTAKIQRYNDILFTQFFIIFQNHPQVIEVSSQETKSDQFKHESKATHTSHNPQSTLIQHEA